MPKYLIDYVEVMKDEFEKTLEEAIEAQAYDSYDDMLDDVYPEVKIMGVSYYTSHVLKKVDEVMYREGLLDYEDSIRADVNYELDRGKPYHVDGKTFLIEE